MSKKLNYEIVNKDSEQGAKIDHVWRELMEQHAMNGQALAGVALSSVWGLMNNFAVTDGTEVKYIVINELEESESSVFQETDLLTEEFPVPYGTKLFGFDAHTGRRFAVITGRLGNLVLGDWNVERMIVIAHGAPAYDEFMPEFKSALTYQQVTSLTALPAALEKFLKNSIAHAREVDDEEAGVLRAVLGDDDSVQQID